MNQSTIREMADRKKPHVQLSGLDGNAFSIMARVRSSMRDCGWTKAEIAEATDNMMAGDYDALIRAACTYCEVV